MFVTNPIGIIGEEEASKILKKKGYRILEHNWRMGHLEIDLIAENRKEIVFIEVKARTSTFGDKRPEEYVDDIKKQRLTAAANSYIKYNKIEKTPRFDIIGILVDPETQEITYRCHIEKNSYSGSWKWSHKNHVIK